MHPNKAELKTEFHDQIRPVSQRPTDVVFKTMLASDVEDVVDWDSAGDDVWQFPFSTNEFYQFPIVEKLICVIFSQIPKANIT